MPSLKRRVFSHSRSSILNGLNSSISSSDSDPLGDEWPPEKHVPVGTLHCSTTTTLEDSIAVAQWPAAQSKVSSGVTVSEKTFGAIQLKVPGHSTTQSPLSLSSSTVAAGPQRKPVSKGSKENVADSKRSQVMLDPPLVHPLRTYSYKDFKPAPTRVYVRHEEEANRLVGALSGAVGFDLEWRVLFCKGMAARPAATVQLSDQRTILVIQVSAMKGFPKKLKEILENPNIAKVGVNILNDGNKLARDYSVHPQGLVELGRFAQQADKHCDERFSRASELLNNESGSSSRGTATVKRLRRGAMINLATITTMYTGRELQKGPVRASNWEMQPLSEIQLEYAANDAHCALTVYNRLIELAKAANIELERAKYTYGVKADYGISTGTTSTPCPARALSKATLFKQEPFFQAPVLVSKTSCPSSSSAYTTISRDIINPFVSTSTSLDHCASSSVSTRLSASSTPTPEYAPTKPKRAAISSVAYTEVSDDDVEVLEIRVLRTADQSTTLATDTSKSIPINNSSVSSSSVPASGFGSNRTRPGPRFKPSYNTLSTTKISRALSPSETDVMTASPSRSPRFKPSYNSTMKSRSPSPMKSSLTTNVETSSLQSGQSGQSAAPSLLLPHQASPTPSTPTSTPTMFNVSTNQRPQHIRAYNLWHIRQFSLPEICSVLRSPDNPLKSSTVISYVVTALQTDPKLHFSHERLRVLLSSDPKSWLFYRDWFRTLNTLRYVNMEKHAKPKPKEKDGN